jgi:hypothetical protein
MELGGWLEVLYSSLVILASQSLLLGSSFTDTGRKSLRMGIHVHTVYSEKNSLGGVQHDASPPPRI